MSIIYKNITQKCIQQVNIKTKIDAKKEGRWMQPVSVLKLSGLTDC